ncbi:MAG: hypothetical protein KDA24_09780 [Deltaproteobacteria bacterium]|nr:hypothetical protein [Deltaproteobacteria bacterium]
MKLSLVTILTASLALAAWSPALADDAPKVTLVEAGSGKLEALRLAPKAGDKATVTMDMDMTMSMSFGGQTMPPQTVPTMRMGMDMVINEVKGEEFTTTFVYTKATVDDAAGLPEQAVETLRGVLGGLVGSEGHTTMTTRGFVKDGSFVPAEAADPQIKDMAASMEKQLTQLAAPFPAEPVGVGAKWTVAMAVSNQGMVIDQTAEYTLTKREGNMVYLDVAITQGAEAQTLSTPQGEAKVNSVKSTGTGTVTIDLSLALPAAGNTKLNSAMSMEMDMQGQTVAMDTVTDMGLSLSSELKK